MNETTTTPPVTTLHAQSAAAEKMVQAIEELRTNAHQLLAWGHKTTPDIATGRSLCRSLSLMAANALKDFEAACLIEAASPASPPPLPTPGEAPSRAAAIRDFRRGVYCLQHMIRYYSEVEMALPSLNEVWTAYHRIECAAKGVIAEFRRDCTAAEPGAGRPKGYFKRLSFHFRSLSMRPVPAILS